jgi:hypothetical protein
MNTPSDRPRHLAHDLPIMGGDPGDPWRGLADSVERYADGKEQLADFFPIRLRTSLRITASR